MVPERACGYEARVPDFLADGRGGRGRRHRHERSTPHEPRGDTVRARPTTGEGARLASPESNGPLCMSHGTNAERIADERPWSPTSVRRTISAMARLRRVGGPALGG